MEVEMLVGRQMVRGRVEYLVRYAPMTCPIVKEYERESPRRRVGRRVFGRPVPAATPGQATRKV